MFSFSHTKRNSRITLAGVVGLPVLALLLSGCAGSQPSQMPPSAGASSQSADPSSSAVAGDVTTISLKFMPDTITVKAGTTVEWVNGETIEHTITSGAWGDVNASTGQRGSQSPDGKFNYLLQPKGQSGDTFSFTFTTPGTYPYYCDIHHAMQGTIVVQ